MKLLENQANRSDYLRQYFHAVVVQTETADERELLVMEIEAHPDVIWSHQAYRLDDYAVENAYIVMFYAQRDISADVPGLFTSVEAQIKAEQLSLL